MSDDARLTFKEMCAKFEVTPRTLRYYEYIELIAPDREGRTRFYGPRERARKSKSWQRKANSSKKRLASLRACAM